MSQRDIIAIGGSLGALEAARTTLANFPPGLPAAVFLIIHTPPDGPDLLPGIVGKESNLPVRTAVEGEDVVPGRVYVAPADRHLLVIDGTVRLGRGPRENMARPAIDPLFRSVALEYGSRVVALLLSGMLHDGTAGLVEVARCGGTTVVQNPADAIAADMPLQALRACDVGFRAPAAELGDLLARLVREPGGPAPTPPDGLRLEVEIALGRPLDSGKIASLGSPSTLTCPDCGGVLAEMRQPPLRFRCQTGHAYTAGALADHQEQAVDEAVRVALRIVEERAVLVEKLAEEARSLGRTASARQHARRAEEYRRHAEQLRDAALRSIA